jgi:hypothetical protein
MLTVEQNKTENWSLFLLLVQCFMDSSIHISTGHRPSQLMFGDAVNLRQNLFPTNANDLPLQPTSPFEWIHSLIDKQAAMLEVARIHQEELNETNIAVQTENRGDRALANHSIED